MFVGVGDELSGLRGEAGGEVSVRATCECECWLRVLESETDGRRREEVEGRRARMSMGGIAISSSMSRALSSSSLNCSSISKI